MISEYSSYSDQELIELLQSDKSNESLCFNELYERYESMLFAYVRVITSNEETTQDIVQESFIRFYRTIKKGNEFSNVPGFLIKISKNLCLNNKRDKKQEVSPEDYLVHTSENQEYEKKELLELVISSLESLNEKHRRVFILREFEGLKFKDIAKRENITVANAKLRAVRAKRQVIDILQPYIKDLSR